MKRLRRGLRDQMQDHLGIGGGLHHGAVANEVAAQRKPIGEIAVMRDREPAGVQFGEQRLHVAQDGLARGRIADMSDGRCSRQPLDHLAAGKGVADEAKPALAVKSAAVEGDDARRFLAAVLQGVQSERCDGGGLGMAENAKHAALLAQRVSFQIDIAKKRLGLAQFQMKLRGIIGRALHLVHRASLLEHDPEKWKPAFPRDKRGSRVSRGEHARTKT